MPSASSLFYSRNIAALLLSFVKDGELVLDFGDEVAAATVITHDGGVVQEATKALLEAAVGTTPGGVPA
jgi:hypothetical protein